ncbi:MAG: immunoglobulin domain-containing protein [Verrucomicrobiaceae bacterium]|nr:immunoglobulin domain-containing protein [Verrucomicrobiaceae bacterium]
MSAMLLAAISARADIYFTAHPQLQTVQWGYTAKFSANAEGSSNITYQWHKNGTSIPGATNKVLEIPNAQIEDQGGYYVTIQDGSESYDSEVAPLVITHDIGWRWANRIDTKVSASNDSALSIDVGTRGVWVSGEYNGQFVRKYGMNSGAMAAEYPISTTGDGVSGLNVKESGHIIVGANNEITTPVYSRPGMLQLRDTDGGGLLWTRNLGTEKGGTEAPNGYGDVVAVAPDGNGNILAAGFYQGRGKFGSIIGGASGNSGNNGYIAKYDNDGVAVWMRDIKCQGDADDCYVHDMVIDNLGDIYIAGVIGVNGSLQRSATYTDRTASLANTYRRPFVAKYTTAGVLQWWKSPDEEGEFLSIAVDAAGSVWVTGYIGSNTDITSRSALIEKYHRTTGNLVTTATVDDLTGCAVRTKGVQVFWLAMDSTGVSSIRDVVWGTSCFRCCLFTDLDLDLDDLAWEVPAFGGMGERSDRSDAVLADDGSIFTALNFTSSDMSQRARFPKSSSYSLVNRGRDGFVAQIGELPVIESEPQDIIVEKGTEVSLVATAGGIQTSTFQWYKEGLGKVPYETYNAITFPAITLSQFGGYKVRVTKGGNSVDSSYAYVSVVDPYVPNVTLALNKKLTLTCKASGVDLQYQWLKNGVPLNTDTRVNGTSTRTMTIWFVVPPDGGEYTCRVTGPGGSITTDPSTVTVVIPPVISDFSFPSSMTSGSYSFTPPTLNAATSYIITGLPKGMSYNPKTGAISGRPTIPGSYRIRITATNAAGSSVREKVLTVSPLPSYVTGMHVGAVSAPSATTDISDPYGRWTATVLADGTYTGTFRFGGRNNPIAGRVSINNTSPYSPKLTPTIVISPTESITASIDLLDTFESTGTFSAIRQAGSLPGYNAQGDVVGWRQARMPIGRSGTYNFAVTKPTSQPLPIPGGYGPASLKLSDDGTTILSGRLSDGSAFATTAFASLSGKILIYQSLYQGLGSLAGTMKIVDDAASASMNNTVTGKVMWNRRGSIGDRYRTSTFNLEYDVVGSRYIKPSGIVMGLPAANNNAKLTFRQSGISMSFSEFTLPFTISSLNIPALPTTNPNSVTVTVNAITGQFSGSFTLVDPDPYIPGSFLYRKTQYFGNIWLNSQGVRRGYGYFVVDMLPDANANPPTTTSTSPRIAGEVLLGPP